MINKISPFLASMTTWDVGISGVTFSVSLVVASAETCTRAIASENMPLIVGSYGMAYVAEAECD